MQRYEVLFSGRVQGVGFRMTARQVARGRPITGYVQNLSSGEVRLVAEGPASELDELVSDIERHMEGFVRDTRIDRRPATGEFENFSIRH
ncbi:MAG: acylphosphatase [Pirellulales bacterium]